MKDLLGGEERVDPEASYWADAFIVNLGIAGYEDVVAPGALQTIVTFLYVFTLFQPCVLNPGLLLVRFGSTSSTHPSKPSLSPRYLVRSCREVEGHTLLPMA